MRYDMTTPVLGIAYLSAISRFNLQAVGNGGGFFNILFAFMVLGTVVILPYLATRLVIHNTPSDKMESPYYIRSVIFQRLAVRLHFPDMVCVFGSIVNGFVLLGRVYAGKCPDNVSIWSSQTCNPFAEVASIPPDQVIFVYLSPIIIQLIIRGISGTALVSSWLIGLASVAMASSHVGGYQQIWILAYSIFFLSVIFMIEELTHTTFMQGQAMTAAYAASCRQVSGLLLHVMARTHFITSTL